MSTKEQALEALRRFDVDAMLDPLDREAVVDTIRQHIEFAATTLTEEDIRRIVREELHAAELGRRGR